MHAYDEQTRHSGVIYVLMLVIALAFGGFVWQLYRSPDIPRIAAPPGPYKVEPATGSAADDAESSGEQSATASLEEALPPETIADTDSDAAPPGPPQLAPAPRFVADGPYVAQLAALQSEAAVDLAWRRLSSWAPGLFASARLDVERADLGQRGVYYRVRAGYFAGRADAAQFCERIRQMGQDCIPAAR